MKSVLIHGDLALDIEATSRAAVQLEGLQSGQDVTLDLDTASRLGGSAWSFAQSLLATTGVTPRIIGCLGSDLLGSAVREGLSARDVRLDGLEATDLAATSLIYVAFLFKGERLMLQPARHANHYLSRSFVTELLSAVDPREVSLIWLSGYCLADRTVPRFEAVCYLCDWGRANEIPIFLDLVPHNFRTRVGPLEDVERWIGPVNGLVSEYFTLADLLSLPLDPGDRIEESLGRVAEETRRTRRIAIVQHRVSRHQYVQLVHVDNGPRPMDTFDFDSKTLRGLGDRMAVQALLVEGLL